MNLPTDVLLVCWRESAGARLEWAYAEKLITGKDGKCLDPQGQASRAEVATILMRLLESKAKNA